MTKISPKETAKAVLEEIIEDNSQAYDITSCYKIGELSQNLKLFYANSFVEQAKENLENSRFLKEFSKFHNIATTYGYRGYSARKNNGIVEIKPSNKRLLKDYNKLITQEVIEQFKLNEENLTPIKIVAHVTNGNRLIGTLDKTKGDYNIVVILGLSNYNGKSK